MEKVLAYHPWESRIAMFDETSMLAILPVCEVLEDGGFIETDEVDAEKIKIQMIKEAIHESLLEVQDKFSEGFVERFFDEQIGNIHFSWIYGTDDGIPFVSLSIMYCGGQPYPNGIELATLDYSSDDGTTMEFVFEEVESLLKSDFQHVVEVFTSKTPQLVEV